MTDPSTPVAAEPSRSRTEVVRFGLLGSGFVADVYLDGLRDGPGTRVVAN